MNLVRSIRKKELQQFINFVFKEMKRQSFPEMKLSNARDFVLLSIVSLEDVGALEKDEAREQILACNFTEADVEEMRQKYVALSSRD